MVEARFPVWHGLFRKSLPILREVISKFWPVYVEINVVELRSKTGHVCHPYFISISTLLPTSALESLVQTYPKEVELSCWQNLVPLDRHAKFHSGAKFWEVDEPP